MLYSGLILAAVLPLLVCGQAKAESAGLEGPVSYAAYHSEWGEKLTPPIARSLHLELSGGKLNVSLSGAMPTLSYTGPVDAKTVDELVALLRSMDAAAWPGASGDENRGERRKDQCEWNLCLAVRQPEYRQKRVYGADKGRDTPRLEAEARLCAYLKEKLAELYVTCPKRLEHLSLSERFENGYWSVAVDEGLVHVCVIGNGRGTVEFYADPALLEELALLLEKHGAQAWHGFGFGLYEPGKMPLCLEVSYSTRQPVVVFADQDRMPKGFAAFCDDLRSTLGALAKRWQQAQGLPPWAIKQLHFGENGMSMQPQYRCYRRLDAQGPRAHIMRSLGGKLEGDVPLSSSEEEELSLILRSLGRWDGFHEVARDVLDAPGFGLSVEFADGRKISAHSYGVFPNGYREGRERILHFLEKRLPSAFPGK